MFSERFKEATDFIFDVLIFISMCLLAGASIVAMFVICAGTSHLLLKGLFIVLSI